MFNWVNNHILKLLAFMVLVSVLSFVTDPNVSWFLCSTGWFVALVVQKELREKESPIICPSCKSNNAFEAIICVNCGAHTAPRRPTKRAPDAGDSGENN